MILISALLASLTGLVSGERPAERARVELSAAAQAVQSGAMAVQGTVRPAVAQPGPRANLTFAAGTDHAAVVPSFDVRTRLSHKQSWLE